VTSPEVASLAREIGEMQRQLRDLATGNPLNFAEVVDASGRSVPITSLAFGSVPASDLGTVSFSVAANAGPGGQGWADWGPWAVVYVSGGKLLVQYAAALVASGNHFSMFMSCAVYGPSATATPASWTALPQVVAASYDRALELQHNAQGQDVRAQFGSFDLHTGLAAGYYRIAGQYAETHSGYTNVQSGTAANRRILATPF
jgi:hypothetical protein